MGALILEKALSHPPLLGDAEMGRMRWGGARPKIGHPRTAHAHDRDMTVIIMIVVIAMSR